MKDIYINGKFLCQRITGVQRYASELVKQLDEINDERFKFHIIKPSGTVNKIDFKNIDVIETKGKAGYFWEQIILPKICRRLKAETLINFCNVAPVFFPGICVLHDLGCIDAPKGFSFRQRVVYKIINRLNVRRYKHIFTVSEYMKKRIEEFYGVNGVDVLYSGREHIADIKPVKPLFIDKFQDYYLAVGSMNPNKNFKSIVRLAKLNPDENFIIAGGNARSFAKEKLDLSENLYFTGYLKDEELSYLYKNCKAFLFPSVYEGFGLPPIEALCSGCKRVLCNDIPVLREIGEGLYTFADFDKAEKISDIEFIEPDLSKLEKYSWEKSARKLLEILER